MRTIFVEGKHKYKVNIGARIESVETVYDFFVPVRARKLNWPLKVTPLPPPPHTNHAMYHFRVEITYHSQNFFMKLYTVINFNITVRVER